MKQFEACGTFFEKDFDDFRATLLAGDVDWPEVPVVGEGRVGAEVEQLVNDVSVAVVAGEVQGRLARE